MRHVPYVEWQKAGRLGPDLSSVGGSRSFEYLVNRCEIRASGLAQGISEP